MLSPPIRKASADKGDRRELNQDRTGIPAKAMELAQRGEVVEPIKITREQTRLSLKDAKEAVDAFIRTPHGTSQSDESNNSHATREMPRLEIIALENGQLNETVKQTRETAGRGLKDAKETVERYLEQNPCVNAKFRSASSAASKRLVGIMILLLALLGFVVLSYQYFFTPHQ